MEMCGRSFMARVRVCMHGFLQEKKLVVTFYLMSLSFKLRTDISFCFGNIAKLNSNFNFSLSFEFSIILQFPTNLTV